MSNLGDGVGLVAYPWLASALTRNPILISGVLVAQRLPWLLFSLPVGVVVDRRNRRNLMIGADTIRAVLTCVVAVAVLRIQTDLPSPEMLDSLGDDVAVPDRFVLFAALLVATFLLGIGEVIHDTAAMTILPQIVDRPLLPSANGRLSSAEQAANLFIGPPVGALLLSGAFALPFLVDASTFALSAMALALLAGTFKSRDPGIDGSIDESPDGSAAELEGESDSKPRRRFRSELADGYHALRANHFVTLFAIVSTVMNLTAGMIFAVMVFFAQDVLDAGPTQFSVLTIGSAIGSVAGGMIAVRLAKWLGLGTVLRAATFAMSISLLALGFTGSWLIAALLLGAYSFWLLVWVVHTTSFRQAVTPNAVLGRLNGVYRFFSFGAIPLGALVAGVLVALVESGQTRQVALRAPFILAGVLQLLTTLAVASRLDSRSLEEARTSDPEVVDANSPDGD